MIFMKKKAIKHRYRNRIQLRYEINIFKFTHCHHCAAHLDAIESILILHMCIFLQHSLDPLHFSYFSTFSDRQLSNVSELVDGPVALALYKNENNAHHDLTF